MTEEEGEGTSPFARSARIARTPPMVSATETERPATPQLTGQGTSHQIDLRPDKDKMKKETKEEEEEKKCRSFISAMKAATKRQPGISSEVKSGIVKLKEAIEIMMSLRTREIPSGKTRRRQATQTEATQTEATQTEEDAPLDTPLYVCQDTQTEKDPLVQIPAPASKRAASSQVKSEEKKRKIVGERDASAPAAGWTKAEPKKKKKKKRAAKEQKSDAAATATELPKDKVKVRSTLTKTRRAAISI